MGLDETKWTCIESLYTKPQLYRELYTDLLNEKSLWISHDWTLCQRLFTTEIYNKNVYCITETDSYLFIDPKFSLDERKESIFLARYSELYFERIIKENHWDTIVFDLLTYPAVTNINKIIRLIEQVSLTQMKGILIYHPGYNKIAKKCSSDGFSKVSPPKQFENENCQPILFKSTAEKYSKVGKIIKQNKGKGVILTAQVKDGELLESYLNEQNIHCVYVRKDLCESEKKYIEDRFSCDNHFYPIDVLIIHNIDQVNLLYTNVKWTIHFHFSDSYEGFSKEICWINFENAEKAIHYLFCSYSDLKIRETMIDNIKPDAKSLRIVYSHIKKSPRWGKYRFVDAHFIYRNLRMSKIKIDLSIEILEKLHFLEKRMPVLGHIQIFFELSYIKKESTLPYPIPSVFSRIENNRIINLVKLSISKGISPLTLSQICFTLHNTGHIHFIQKEMAHCFKITDEHQVSPTLSHTEILKYFPLSIYSAKLDKLYGIALKYLDKNTPNMMWGEIKAISDQPSLTQYVILGVLILINDLKYPVGKHLLSDILVGSKSKKIQRLNLSQLTLYSSFSLIKKEAILEIVIQMFLEGLLEDTLISSSYLKVLRISKKGKEWLGKNQKFMKLFWMNHQNVFSNRKKSIYPLLKKALQESVFDLINEQVLRSIAFFKPQNFEELSMIKGIKHSTAEKLSPLILPITNCVDIEQHKKKIESHPNYFEKDSESEIEKNYFPVLRGQFTKGFSLSIYSSVSEGKRSYSPIGRAVHNFKYKHKKVLPKVITNKVLSLFEKEKYFKTANIIISVPAHSRYPSIGIPLGQWLGEAFKLPFYDDLIIKAKAYLPQKSIRTLSEKRSNVNHVFEVSDKYNIKGLSIILLDDIYDSGSTINACSKILKEWEALNIYVLTCSRTAYREVV